MRWETLILQFEKAKALLENFLNIELPTFFGYEQAPNYVRNLSKSVSLSEGIIRGEKRTLINDDDKRIVRLLLLAQCERLGYQLE